MRECTEAAYDFGASSIAAYSGRTASDVSDASDGGDTNEYPRHSGNIFWERNGCASLAHCVV